VSNALAKFFASKNARHLRYVRAVSFFYGPCVIYAPFAGRLSCCFTFTIFAYLLCCGHFYIISLRSSIVCFFGRKVGWSAEGEGGREWQGGGTMIDTCSFDLWMQTSYSTAIKATQSARANTEISIEIEIVFPVLATRI